VDKIYPTLIIYLIWSYNGVKLGNYLVWVWRVDSPHSVCNMLHDFMGTVWRLQFRRSWTFLYKFMHNLLAVLGKKRFLIVWILFHVPRVTSFVSHFCVDFPRHSNYTKLRSRHGCPLHYEADQNIYFPSPFVLECFGRFKEIGRTEENHAISPNSVSILCT